MANIRVGTKHGEIEEKRDELEGLRGEKKRRQETAVAGSRRRRRRGNVLGLA